MPAPRRVARVVHHCDANDAPPRHAGRGDPALVSSLAFLSPGPGAVAKSPMEPGAVAAGATFEDRDGWKVATSFAAARIERAVCASSVGFADVSQLGKIELQASRDDLAA